MASNPSFDNKTSALEVARTYASQVAGKTILVTGVSHDGIGEAIARAFAEGGAFTIIITGRDATRLSSVTSALSEDYPAVNFRPHQLDLTSLEATHHSASQILQDENITKIDILVANAGGTFQGPKALTPDGFESHFGINHLGHFLFITTLLPKLRVAAQSSAPGETRVILISSIAMVVSPFRFADYNFDGNTLPEDEAPNWDNLKQLIEIEEHDGYNDLVAYAQSKTANSLFAVHWNTLFSKEGIFAFALHPGGVQSRSAKTMFEGMTKEQKEKVKIPFDKDIFQGAATALVAALDRGLTPQKGVYLDDCQIAEAPPYAISEEKAEKLWTLSAELIAQKFSS
ncbi:retinol dehydrogenase 12 [Plenodomus tracheiphilus IPT5]|uniref:Retinol dehydrogenase 12 n=1 Tax=Plenodomus tracheiphilus IPT5 TaxID=1408161 RepID=A0A6A7AQQ5_9PLEO|nr:retinol dehydrogenase 12 [Plenodomus tracheiphilus IPT5]